MPLCMDEIPNTKPSPGHWQLSHPSHIYMLPAFKTKADDGDSTPCLK